MEITNWGGHLPQNRFGWRCLLFEELWTPSLLHHDLVFFVYGEDLEKKLHGIFYSHAIKAPPCFWQRRFCRTLIILYLYGQRFAFFLIAGILSDNNVIKIMSDILILCPSSTNISEPIQFCLNCWRMRFICVLTEWFYCEKQASFTQYTEHFPKELPYCISVTYILDCIFW